jgi:hypothetical protein
MGVRAIDKHRPEGCQRFLVSRWRAILRLRLIGVLDERLEGRFVTLSQSGTGGSSEPHGLSHEHV